LENDVGGSDILPPIDDEELLFIRTNAAPLLIKTEEQKAEFVIQF